MRMSKRSRNPNAKSGAGAVRLRTDKTEFPWLDPILLSGVVTVIWWNSLGGVFLLDDVHSITANATIRDFWSLAWLKPPSEIGETVGGRPFLNFTFALDYALHGAEASRGYHVTNLLIHSAAAMGVLGILRRVFPGEELEAGRSRKRVVAFAVAAIWAVHPLQTGAVTYLSQRAESLAGFFIVTGFYAYLRSRDDGRRSLWTAASVGLAFLGAMTKETALVLPVLVGLHAWMHERSGDFWRRWRTLLAGYGVVWALWLVMAAGGFRRGGSAGWETEIGVGEYMLTQLRAVGHYLRQAFWPDGLVFDFGATVVSRITDVWIQGVLVLSLLGFAVFGVIRRRGWGFALAAFFVLLAPSSSFVPVATQTIAEHRVYLPLLVAIGFGVSAWLAIPGCRRRWSSAVALMVVVAGMTAGTWQRNGLYHSAIALWSDTTAKVPDNPRAFNNLGVALLEEGRLVEAREAFGRAIVLRPNHAFARHNLGTVFLRESRWAEAVVEFQAAVAADPKSAESHFGMGIAWVSLDKKAEAEGAFRAAVDIDPGLTDALTQLAVLKRESGARSESVALLQRAVADGPENAEARYELAISLERDGRLQEALREMEAALQLRADWAEAWLASGNIRYGLGDTVRAERDYREALRLSPGLAEARYALGSVLARRERFEEAAGEFRAALALDSEHIKAWANLGNCLMVLGNAEDAIRCYDEVLKRTPDDARVRQNRQIAEELLASSRGR